MQEASPLSSQCSCIIISSSESEVRRQCVGGHTKRIQSAAAIGVSMKHGDESMLSCALVPFARPNGIPRQPSTRLVPGRSVGVCDHARHQMSPGGKFFHISRRSSAMSSSEISISNPAQRPSGLRNGALIRDALKESANFSTSSRFSSGKVGTFSRIAPCDAHVILVSLCITWTGTPR